MSGTILWNGNANLLNVEVNNIQNNFFTDAGLPATSFHGLAMLSYNDTGSFDTQFDNLRVRHYAYTEPGVTSGTEESLSAEITTYSLPGQTGSATINSTAGTIGVTMPAGTVVTSLVATFTTGVIANSVTIGSTSQVSGVTANNFTSRKRLLSTRISIVTNPQLYKLSVK